MSQNVKFLKSWLRDDEGNIRPMALELFAALGSEEKTLHAKMGGHRGVPQNAGEEATRFFVRQLNAVKQ